jgi:hypothetical protein
VQRYGYAYIDAAACGSVGLVRLTQRAWLRLCSLCYLERRIGSYKASGPARRDGCKGFRWPVL